MSIASRLATPQVLGTPPRWRSVFGVGAAGLLVGVVLVALQLARVGPDPTAPLFVGSAWELDDLLADRDAEVVVVPGTGYDGQWFYGLALDPLLRENLTAGFDMPRYRAGRPLLGMAAWLLAAGRAEVVPTALLAVGPLALAVGAAAVARLAVAAGRSRWWGLGFCAIPGVVVGVTHATAEPLGLAAVAVGLSLTVAWRAGRGHPALAGLAFAAAALTKESYLVFALVAAAVVAVDAAGPPRSSRPSRVRAAAWVLLPGIAALAAWMGYVAVQVPPSAGDVRAVDAVGWPGVGWLAALRAWLEGEWVADAPVGPLGPALMLGSLAALAAGILAGWRRPGLLGWSALVLGGYGLLLSGYLLGHFLSSMRALAPCVLAAGLGALALTARGDDRRPRRGPEPAAAEPVRTAEAPVARRQAAETP